MSIEAGKLRHKVTLQEKAISRDPVTGDVISAWIDIATIRAQIVPLSVREFMAGAIENSRVSARIVIRFRDNINHSMRLLHKNKVYNIEGILADADSGLEYLTLPVSEGSNEG